MCWSQKFGALIVVILFSLLVALSDPTFLASQAATTVFAGLFGAIFCGVLVWPARPKVIHRAAFVAPEELPLGKYRVITRFFTGTTECFYMVEVVEAGGGGKYYPVVSSDHIPQYFTISPRETDTRLAAVRPSEEDDYATVF